MTAGKVSLDALKDVRRRNEILLRGILCLLVLNEAKDWKMDGNTFRTEEESLDIHHVFAQNYLLSIGKPKSETDRILNLTLLKSSTNQAIRDQAPDTVLARTDIDNNALAAHLFDPVLLSAKDYDAVLAARLLRLQEFLKNRFPWVSITQGDED